jgi:DNA polymerase III epsilon subunit-like protein
MTNNSPHAYLIFDVETTGLPRLTRFRKYYDPRQSSYYDTSRMLSIAWIVLDEAYNVVGKANHIIKPDGFDVPMDSTMIHGITQDYAHENGAAILEVFDDLRGSLEKVHTIVAHNIEFDIHVLKSELHRYAQTDVLRSLDAKRDMYCTMHRGKEHFKLQKLPKLKELYGMVYDEPMINPHDAFHDAWHCCKCFVAMRAGRKQVADDQTRQEEDTGEEDFVVNIVVKDLDEDQRRVVYAPIAPPRSTLVLACAGSGKTSTMIARIKHLIDSGVHASSIMLTTFTHNAATDMRNRLDLLMGDRVDAVQSLWLGTFDSISLQAMTMHGYDASTFGRIASGNYCSVMDRFMGTDEGIHFTTSIKYLFVDEFQDVNDLQYNIIQRFADRGAYVTCVGDDSQNIYTFRDSNIRYITDFAKMFRDPEIMHLRTNYRSSVAIVNLANASVRMNPTSMKLDMIAGTASRADDPLTKPSVHYFASCDSEAAYLRAEIGRLHKNSVPLSEIAVLAPRNKDLYTLEEHLTKHDVAHVLLDGNSRKRSRDHVCLSTIHKAKGLEWRYVFVIGMNDTPFPFDKHAEAIQEGRRLFYVAITRARDSLSLCCTRFFMSSRLSRYICELDKTLFGAFHNCYPHQLQMQSLQTQAAEEKMRGRIGTARDCEQGLAPPCDWTAVPCASDCVFAFADSDMAELGGMINAYNLHDVLETFVHMMFGCMLTPTNATIRDCKEAVLCVSGAVLDYEERMVYQEHKASLDACLPVVQDLMTAAESRTKKKKASRVLKARRSIIAAVLRQVAIDKGKKESSMSSQEYGTILQILCKLERIQQRSGLALADIPIIRKEQLLRTEFIEAVNRAYERYRRVCDWQEVCGDAWELARCVCIARERRRRLMFSPSASDECKMHIMNAVMPILHAMHAHASDVLNCYARVTCVSPCILLHKDSGHADLMHVAALSRDESSRQRMDDLAVMYDAKLHIESTTEYRIDSIVWMNALAGTRVTYTFES